DKALDNELIALAEPALERREPVRIDKPIRNIHRTVGAMLSGEVAKHYGHVGLPEDTIWARFDGNAGGSFGAFVAAGVTPERRGAGAQPLWGEGSGGGRGGRPAAPPRPPRADREHHHRQHRALRRDRRRRLFRGRGG